MDQVNHINKTPKVYGVVVLSGPDFFAKSVGGFKYLITELGYIENQNILYDLQKTTFDIVSYRNILKKFINYKVNVIFIYPTEALLEAKRLPFILL